MSVETLSQIERELMNVSHMDLTRKSKFVENPEKLDDLEIGEVVQINLIGPMVYGGRTEKGYKFLSHILDGDPTRVIVDWNGENPFIARDGEELLDFSKIHPDAYAYECDPEKYEQEARIIIGAVK